MRLRFTLPALLTTALLTAAPGLSSAHAAPFVFPDRWSAQPAGQPGGTLKVARVDDVPSFNPFVSDLGLYQALTVTASGLLMLDPKTLKWIPYQAESYTVSQDHKTWTFQIRPGMRWSSGQPITAKDFETSCRISTDMNMMQSAGHAHFMFKEGHMACAATGKMTLRVTLPAVMPDAPIILAYLKPQPDWIFGAAYRKDPASVLRLWPATMNPAEMVVAGPFQLEKYTPGKELLLKRNPHFGDWNRSQQGARLPYLAHVRTLIFNGQNDRRVDALTSGTLDTLLLEDYGPLQAALAAPRTRAGKLRVLLNGGPAYRLERFALNWNAADPEKRALFRDVRFRSALNLLTDRPAMSRAIGGATVMTTDVLPVYPGLIDRSVPVTRYDPAGAVKLLLAAGLKRTPGGTFTFASGRPLRFSVAYNRTNIDRERLLAVFSKSARSVGLNITPGPVASRLWQDMMFGSGVQDGRRVFPAYDAVSYDLGGESMFFPFDAETHTCPGVLWMPNRSGVCRTPGEQRISDLYAQGAHLADDRLRLEVTRKIQREVARELPWNLLVAPNWNYAVSDRVRGVYPAGVMSGLLSVGDLTLMWTRPD